MAAGQYLEAIEVTPTSCIAVMTVQDELTVTVPGRAFKQGAKNDPLTQRAVDRTRPIHALVQRAMTGAKQTNAKKDLPVYIGERVLVEDRDGPLGDLAVSVLYTPDRLEVVDGFVDIRGKKLIYLDGESRGEGELTFVEQEENGTVDLLLGRRRAYLIHHSIGAERAASLFGDYNGKGQPVTQNLLIARDTVDPFATVSRSIFDELGVTLELEKRQVAPKSGAIFTALSARLMTAAVFHGVNVVQYGAKAIPTHVVDDDKRRVDLDQERLHDAALKWVGYLLDTFTPEAFLDRDRVLRAAPVLVSLGAVGRTLYSDPTASASKVGAVLDGIDWQHDSKKWDGIAGKRNAEGRFSVGSGKEAAHATFAALTKPDSAGYHAIRG
jgi:hypothetical protein